MKCPKCSKKIDDDALTCPHCEYSMSREMMQEVVTEKTVLNDADKTVLDSIGKTVFDNTEETALDNTLLDDIKKTWKSIIDTEDIGKTIKESVYEVKAPSQINIRQTIITEAESAPSDRPSDYEILKKIGEGGMGVIYTARQSSVDRVVALKMVKGEQEERKKDLFLSEAVATGNLDHPNIVPIYDLGSDRQGQLFYSMKNVTGTAWNEVIRERSRQENLEILLRVCDAMAFAHSKGVIHRDLKPENVMLGEYGEVYVLDWGLAVSVSAEGKAQMLSEKTSAGGTPVYMAPEMGKGDLSRIGKGSDIYLLGGILFKIVTGKVPHTGKDIYQCLYNVINNNIQEAGERGELIDIAYKAMSKDPRNRYGRVLDLQKAIREYQEHSESLSLTKRAEQDTEEAAKMRDYNLFSEALFGFKQAVTMWEGNKDARMGLSGVRLRYAKCAFEKGDLDLSISLLQPGDPRHASLAEEVRIAQKEREGRKHRIKLLTRTAYGLVLAVLIVMAVAFVWIRSEYQKRFALQQTKSIDDICMAFSARLESPKMTKGFLTDMEQMAQRLWNIAPEKALEYKKKLYISFAKLVNESLRNPKLDDKGFKEIETALHLLRTRSPEAIPGLEEQMKRRRRDWRIDLVLVSPYEDIEKFVDKKSVVVSESGITAASDVQVIISRIQCNGDSRIKAVFRAGPDTKRFGLLLNGYANKGYRFEICFEEPSEDEVLEKGSSVKKLCMVIMRNNEVLRRHDLGLSRPEGSYRITAQRIGNRLEFSLNDKDRIANEDVFSLIPADKGYFGVVMNKGSFLESVKISRRSRPLEATPLEKGDELFVARKFSEAEEYYGQQAITARDEDIRWECRYKQALCYLNLDRGKEAESLLQELSGKIGKPWPLLATCQMLYLDLQKSRFERANAVFTTLSMKYDREELLAYIPPHIRRGIIMEYQEMGFGIMGVLSTDQEKKLGLLKQVSAIQKFFQADIKRLLYTEFAKFRILRMAGRRDEAIKVVEEQLRLFEKYPGVDWFYPWIEEYSWLLRVRGEPEKALSMVNRYLYDDNGKLLDVNIFLLVERARIHAVLGQWSDAEKDLEELIANDTHGKLAGNYKYLSGLYLIKGFVRKEQGDEEAALNAWQRGFFRDPDKSTDPLIEGTTYLDEGFTLTSGTSVYHFGLLCGLSGELSNPFLNKGLDTIVTHFMRMKVSGMLAESSVTFLRSVFETEQVIFPLARKMVRTPEWTAMTRHITFQDVPYPDYISLPFTVLLKYYIQELAIDGPISVKDSEFLERTVERLYTSAATGEINRSLAMEAGIPFMFLFKGMTGFDSWVKLEPNLKPWMIGPSAYLLGHRFLKLGRSPDALKFFKKARENAGKDELLHELAEEKINAVLSGAEIKTAKAAGAGGTTGKLSELNDARINESSGIACGWANKAVFWTHNDSGHEPEIYAFNKAGKVLGVFRVKGAELHDWEDMASVKINGRAFLLIADTGNNIRDRESFRLYFVKEPMLGSGYETEDAKVLDFTYKEGAMDCEAVAIDPLTYRIYLIAKKQAGKCAVYELPSPLDWDNIQVQDKKTVAEQIGEFDLRDVTAMDISADGELMIVLTYHDAYEFMRKKGETWAETVTREESVKRKMPLRKQGESICYGRDSRTLYLTSEVPLGQDGLVPFFEVLPLEKGND